MSHAYDTLNNKIGQTSRPKHLTVNDQAWADYKFTYDNATRVLSIEALTYDLLSKTDLVIRWGDTLDMVTPPTIPIVEVA
jgi:hypothetical protein